MCITYLCTPFFCSRFFSALLLSTLIKLGFLHSIILLVQAALLNTSGGQTKELCSVHILSNNDNTCEFRSSMLSKLFGKMAAALPLILSLVGFPASRSAFSFPCTINRAPTTQLIIAKTAGNTGKQRRDLMCVGCDEK